MELKDQVTSLKPSKKLKDLGVKQESYFYWVKWIKESHKYTPEGWVIERFPHTAHADCKSFSAFTVAELGKLLQDSGEPLPWYAEGAWQYYKGDARLSAETEADARADILIYVLEKKNV